MKEELLKEWKDLQDIPEKWGNDCVEKVRLERIILQRLIGIGYKHFVLTSRNGSRATVAQQLMAREEMWAEIETTQHHRRQAL